jgi:hypothetical protein
VKPDLKTKILILQKSFVANVLTLAEIGLPPQQFEPFKKKVFAELYDVLRPETIRALEEVQDDRQK